jgi:hypothetical protein
MKEENNHEKSALLIKDEKSIHYNLQEILIRAISVKTLMNEIQKTT